MARKMTLQWLRASEGLTQQTVAERMKTTQPSVGRIERRADVRLSTMKRFADALGCRIDLLVTFPDGREFRIDHFSDAD